MRSLHSPSTSPNVQLLSGTTIAHAATSTGRLHREEFLMAAIPGCSNGSHTDVTGESSE